MNLSCLLPSKVLLSKYTECSNQSHSCFSLMKYFFETFQNFNLELILIFIILNSIFQIIYSISKHL